MRKSILPLMMVLMITLSGIAAYADCSEDPNDYLFYEDFESGANYNSSGLWASSTMDEISINTTYYANGTQSLFYKAGNDAWNGLASIATFNADNYTIAFYASKVAGCNEYMSPGLKYNGGGDPGSSPMVRWKNDGASVCGNWNYYSDAWYTTGVAAATPGAWDYIRTIYEGANMKSSLNYGAWATTNVISLSASHIYIFEANQNTFTGLVDTLVMWNRTIYGDTCPPQASTSITLDAPADNNVTNKDVNFTFSVLYSDTDSCTLYGDWSGTFSANATITGTPVGSYDFGKQGIGNTAGTYLWNVKCLTGATEFWATSNNTLIIDLQEPAIIIDEDASDFGDDNLSTSHGNPYNDTIRYFYDIVDDRDVFAYAINVTIDGVNKYSKGGTTSTTNFELNGTINVSSWDDGVYSVLVEASDSHTAHEIPEYAISKSKSKLNFNTVEGNNIWIESDDDASTDTEKLIDRYSFSFNFYDGQTKARAFDVRSDNPIIYRENSDYKAHFVVLGDGLNGNWIDFEGVPGTPNIIKINDYHYKVIFPSLSNKVKFDSIGGLNTNSESNTFYVGKALETTPLALTNEPTSLALNITGVDTTLSGTISANLTYNGTLYQVTTSTFTNVTTKFFELFSQSFTAPYTAGTYYYSWSVDVEQTDGTHILFSTPQASQVVATWGLDACAVQANKTIIYSIFDEKVPTTPLNATWEVDISYWVSNLSNYQNFSTKLEDSTNFSLCISHEMSADIYIKYTTEYGFTHRYYAFNKSLTSTLENADLYNFNTTTDISSLQLTTRNVETYDYYPNILGKLMRFYPDENIYRPVQMYLSGGFGLMVFNIEEVTTDYKIVFSDQDNNILRELPLTSYKCANDVCELNVLITPISTSVSISTTGVSYTYDNDTGLITILWNEPSGQLIDITYSVDWIRSDGFVNICTDAANAVAGTFVCNVTGYYGSVYLRLNSTKSGTTYQDYGEIINLLSERLYSVTNQSDASLWSFVLLLPIVLSGMASPVLVLIAACIGLIVLFYLQLLSFISIGVLVLYIIGGLAIALLIRT